MPTLVKKKKPVKKTAKRPIQSRCENPECGGLFKTKYIVTRDDKDLCQWCVCGLPSPAVRARQAEDRVERMVKQWYAVAVWPGAKLPDRVGYDGDGTPYVQNRAAPDKVREAILRKAKVEGWYPELVGRVLVPTEKQIVLKKGRRRLENRKAFHNYIVVQCVMTAEVITMIQETNGVLGILPLRPDLKGFRYPRKEPRQARPPKKWEVERAEGWQPMPLSEEEVDEILKRDREKRQAPAKVKLPYKPGDKVKVKSGAWKGYSGPVVEIHGEEWDPVVKVTVQVLGRPVDVDLLYREVERSR